MGKSLERVTIDNDCVSSVISNDCVSNVISKHSQEIGIIKTAPNTLAS